MIWLALPALAAAAYYALAVVAAARWSRSTPSAPAACPPVSILKPVRGRDPRFWDAIRSHAEQQYPEFEILFGVSDAGDPALEDISRLEREYPALRIRTHVVSTTAPNAKAGVLAELARQARYPVLLVNDSDIRVPPGYLAAVTAPLADPAVGLVTCLYRAAAESLPARAEALGIATEFAPSVLVARLLGVAEFALGSTMVFRSSTLAEIGGFEAISDYLADDYQSGAASTSAATTFALPRWWSRPTSAPADGPKSGATSCDGRAPSAFPARPAISDTSSPTPPFGPPSRLPPATGPSRWLAMALRLWAGIWTGAGILGDPKTARDFWLIPFRDLAGFAVWLAGLFGDTVDWRGQKLRLSRSGTIRS